MATAGEKQNFLMGGTVFQRISTTGTLLMKLVEVATTVLILSVLFVQSLVYSQPLEVICSQQRSSTFWP